MIFFYIIFLYINITIIIKMRGILKKNAPFLDFGKKKRIKKTSTTPKWKCRGRK